MRHYSRPSIETIEASDLVESLGPVQGYNGGPDGSMDSYSQPESTPRSVRRR